METRDETEPIPTPTFAELLKRLRVAAALTQEELADRAGLSRNAISALERGERLRPQRDTVDLLVTALDLTGDDQETFTAVARTGPRTRPDTSPAAVDPPTNLPLPPTSLIGREAELTQACAFLQEADVRLLTLTGPGGVGKTRLALEVAAHLHRGFADGVFLVSLAPLTAPALVAATIAQVFDLREKQERSAAEELVAFLRERRLLLILDNFERLTDGATLLADLLAVCPALKLLVTSRSPVRVRGEQVLPVLPLPLPDPADAVAIDRLRQVPAVALFVRCARAALPNFELTTEVGPAVAEIVRRLDGLPLAIELAAARTPLLPPPALLTRLTEAPPLPLLTDGARDLPERQRTMRRTIEWSYELLNPEEQRIFRRLSIFVGGATLDAAECVSRETRVEGRENDVLSHDSRLTTLDSIASLVDKNLLRREDADAAEPRVAMLETVRAFGQELLASCGELAETRRRAVDYFLTLAERAEPQLTGPEQRVWLDRLEAEHDNLRESLAWAAESREAEPGLRLAGALALFWHVRGHARAGRSSLEGAAERGRGNSALAALRVKALCGAARLAAHLGDFAAAVANGEEALAIARELGDRREIARALNRLASVAGQRGDYERNAALHEEALSIHRDLGNQEGIAYTLADLGQAALVRGAPERATVLLDEAVDRLRALGDERALTIALGNLGRVAMAQGDLDRAAAHYREALALDRRLGYKRGVAIQLDRLAHVARRQGDLGQARVLQAESLGLWRELGDPVDLAIWLEGVSALQAARGRSEQAARFLGAAVGQRASVGVNPDAPTAPGGDEAAATRRATAAVLGEPVATAALEAGRSLPLDAALREAEAALDDAPAFDMVS